MKPAIKHSFEAKFVIKSIKETLTYRVYGGTPIDALHDLHKMVQNTMHYGPDDYAVTFLRRDGFAPYDLPPEARNPDVRPRAPYRTREEPNAMMDLGDVESKKPETETLYVFTTERTDTPIGFPPVGAPEANISSQP